MNNKPTPTSLTGVDQVDQQELQRKRAEVQARLARLDRVLSNDPTVATNPFLTYQDHIDLIAVTRVGYALRDLAPQNPSFIPISTLRRQAVVDVAPIWIGGTIGMSMFVR